MILMSMKTVSLILFGFSQTPSGQEVSSSRKDNGIFVLSLSSSLQSGSYTCHLPTSTPASTCLTPGSPLNHPVPYYLDERDVRLSILEARQGELLEVNRNQTNEIQALQSDNTNLTAENQRLNQTLHNCQNGKHERVCKKLCAEIAPSLVSSMSLSACLYVSPRPTPPPPFSWCISQPVCVTFSLSVHL